VLLRAASYYFYMSWKPIYGFLLFGSTLVDYVAARCMAATDSRHTRRVWLGISLAFNLGLLFIFKYLNLFSETIGTALRYLEVGYAPPPMSILLPVGVSFYTFQSLGYTIDVYRGQTPVERHFGRFALYVSFFPQLVAGPIERPSHLLPQFLVPRQVDYDQMVSGLRLMMWGFFKKLVVADRIAPIVHAVYANPSGFTTVPLVVATHLFAVQIYADFSAYSDIDRGSARVMGFELMRNFRQPYFARSIAEFWQRWHISLSTWFRDYVYLPLGGNRVDRRRWQMNVLAVFLVSGLWHGANWTFVAWGALHGLYMLVGEATAPLRAALARMAGLDRAPRLHAALKVFVTVELVVISWVFFRAASVGDAWTVFARMLTTFELRSGYQLNIGGPYDAVTLALAIGALFMVDWLDAQGIASRWLPAQPLPVRWAAYYAILALVLIFGAFGSQEFIYFQF
jgi:D-alanyl-lipoteichoic acid acyltransferase DltB (MBOAT superfamily)